MLKKIKLEKINRVDQFHLLLKIVSSYPLQEAEEVGGNMDKPDNPVKESQLSEIIISESCS